MSSSRDNEDRDHNDDQGSNDGNKRDDHDDNKSQDDGEENTQGKVFIGGLSWQTTESTLRYYFEKFGELSDVALMVDKRTGKPRGFGFIKMKDPAAADVVMSNEHTIDGRLVDVKRALPRDKAPGPARTEACKCFVGGLSPEVSEKEFGDYFSKFGPVKDAVVMVDRATGSSRGFGFVTFEQVDTVEKVLKASHELKGKFVEIKRAEPRDMRGPGDDQNRGGSGRGGGRGGRGGDNRNRDGGGRGNNGNGGYDNQYPPQNYGSYMGGNMRYPQPYPTAPAGYRGAPYGMPPYGYPPMQANMGYYGSMPPAGGYAGYGAAAGSYGGNGGDSSKGTSNGGYDNPNNAMQGGYGGARPYPYGGAMPYGYGYPPNAAQQGAAPVGAAANSAPGNNTGNSNRNPGANEEGGYGAYRGQGTGQGRADRSYRPY